MVIRIYLSVILTLLLLPNFLFAQTVHPAKEFLDGHRKSYSTKGHAKAKGVNFSIAYPNSWTAAEGERPNIVQKFISDGGHGFESAAISTNVLPLPPGTVLTKADQQKLLAPSELRGALPPGAVISDAQSTEVDGEPAGILEYSMRAERAGLKLQIHVWTLFFLSGTNIVSVQFQVGGPGVAEREVSQRMSLYKPLFISMANSIVFPGKWKAAPARRSGRTERNPTH